MECNVEWMCLNDGFSSPCKNVFVRHLAFILLLLSMWWVVSGFVRLCVASVQHTTNHRIAPSPQLPYCPSLLPFEVTISNQIHKI